VIDQFNFFGRQMFKLVRDKKNQDRGELLKTS